MPKIAKSLDHITHMIKKIISPLRPCIPPWSVKFPRLLYTPLCREKIPPPIVGQGVPLGGDEIKFPLGWYVFGLGGSILEPYHRGLPYTAVGESNLWMCGT